MKLKAKQVYIGIFLLILLSILSFVGYRWYVYKTESVGQAAGSTLKLNGITYVAQWNARPIQTVFTRHAGRTQNGDSICVINGENPNNFVYVIGDMWEETYRRTTLENPKFTTQDVAEVIVGKRTSRDSKIIQQVVHDLNSTKTSPLSNLMQTAGYNLYGLDVRLKSYPGLTFSYVLVSRGTHMFFETNGPAEAGLNIDGTALKDFVLQ